MHKSLRHIPILIGSCLMLVGEAYALDIDTFVRRMERSEADSKATIDYGPARFAGDDVVIDGAIVTYADGTIQVRGETTYSGITETAGGGYIIDLVSAPELAFDFEANGKSATLLDVSATNYVVAGKSGYLDYDGTISFHTGQFEFDGMGFGSLSVDLTRLVDTATGELVMSVDDIKLDLTALTADTTTLAVLKALGVEQVAGSLDVTANVSGDDFFLDYALTADDLGSFSWSATLKGLKLDGLIAVQDALESVGESGVASAELTTGALRFMAEARLVGAHVRYDDDSFAERVIAYLAEQQSVDRAAIVNQTRKATAAELASLNIPPVESLANTAIAVFLADPGSFEIAMRPDNPVPMMAITVVSTINKNGFIPLLGLTITANEPPRP